MNWLTADDWKFFAPQLAGGAAVFLLWAAWRAWRDHRAGRKMFGAVNWLKFGQNALFIGFLLFLSASDEILRRHGWGGFGWVLAAGPFVVIALVVGHVQRRRALQTARPNPLAAPMREPPPSAEERKVNARMVAALIGFAALTIGPIVVISLHAKSFGVAGAGVAFAIAAAALAILLFAVAGRWPGTVTAGAAMDIAASPEAVWRALRPDAARPPWKKIVRRVEALDGEGRTYRLHYFNNDVCTRCGLPRDPESPGQTCRVEILEDAAPRRLRMRATPEGRADGASMLMQHETSTFDLSSLPDGGTRVTVVNVASKPRTWLALLIKFGDPAGEELRALAAHLEGQPVDNMYATGAQRLDAARHAPAFCGCPAQTPAAGVLRGA